MTTTVEKQIIKPNQSQEECIKALNGPIMVLAGPGTGKTFTVVERIKYMLSQNIMPESILCLTYSEAAAAEMKTRLVKEVGAIAGAVVIHTYHAFCTDVIKNNPIDFKLLDGLTVADEMTKRTLMTDAIHEYKPKYHITKWGDADYYVPELLGDVDAIKKSLITKEQYFYNLENHALWQGKMNELEEEKIEREEKNKAMKSFMGKYEQHKKKMGKAREAWEIYEIYDRNLKQNNYIDFNDMLNMVLESFNNNDELLSRVSKKFKYFLVDEYQDTNMIQNNIVFKLAEGAGNDNIFVVGDDDQIIYEFQGARTDTLEKFLKKFPQTKVICLDENNRSTQTILDFSYNVISQDKTRLEFNPNFKQFNIRKSLKAMNREICAKNRPIHLHCFADNVQETNFIVEEIENLIKSPDAPKDKKGNTDLSQIAILTRENGELEKYAELLKAKNIKYQLKKSSSIFDIKSSLLVYFYLKALYNPAIYAEKLFGLLGSEPFDFEAEDYMFLLSQFRLNSKNFIENIRLNIDYNWKNKEKVHKFLKTYDKLKKLQLTENLKNFIIAVCNETGILEFFVNSEINRTENILAIKKIIDEVGVFKRNEKGAFSLGDFIKYLDKASELDIPIEIEKDELVQNAIQLITLHSSKGRQFDYVYMPNLVAKKWEKKRNKNNISLPIIDEDKFIDDDDAEKSSNLRLLFVGITRAKYGLTISYPNMSNNLTQEFTSLLSDVISENGFEKFVHEMTQQDYVLELAKSFNQKKFDYVGTFKDEIQARIKDFVLSPSSLNSYLNCPREFLYNNLLKIPTYETDWSNANYGSAVHKTLENAARMMINENKYPDLGTFIQDFNNNLDKQEFDSDEIRLKYKERGESRLKEFYPHFIETSHNRMDKVEYTLDTVPIDDYIVTGKIDRIEKNNDGTYCLFDYKTGSAKPKSQIADGKDYEKYLNQLRFYKLAYESLYENSRVSMVGLIYPEDFEHNFYIELTQEDNEIIKNKIIETYKNISNMNFEPINKEKNCQYCNYKQLCKLNLF